MSDVLSPGELVDGKYTIVHLLGRGGMGAVYAAFEERLNRRVALKVLLPAAAASADAVTRFEREGRAAAALESEHVSRIFGVGRTAAGIPYIAMELLDGQDLADTLAKRGVLSPGEVIDLMIQACEALSEAHARGIVHRDLKPSNLFYARRVSGAVIVKVLDFGISKATGQGAPTHALTGTTAMMGTPYYMSPEQIREAREVDARTDIWSLGVTMYELLVGKPPFSAESLADLCIGIVLTPHIPVIAVRPDVPPALDAIVSRCLAKDPSARFESADALAHALRAASQSVGALAPAPRPMPAAAPMGPALPLAQPPLTVDPVSRTANQITRSPTNDTRPLIGLTALIGLIALIGVGLVAVVGGLAFGWRQNTEHSTAAHPDGAWPIATELRVDAAAVGPSGAPGVAASSSPSTSAVPPSASSMPSASSVPSSVVRTRPEPSLLTPRVDTKPPPSANTATSATPTKPATLPAGPPPIPMDRR